MCNYTIGKYNPIISILNYAPRKIYKLCWNVSKTFKLKLPHLNYKVDKLSVYSKRIICSKYEKCTKAPNEKWYTYVVHTHVWSLLLLPQATLHYLDTNENVCICVAFVYKYEYNNNVTFSKSTHLTYFHDDSKFTTDICTILPCMHTASMQLRRNIYVAVFIYAHGQRLCLTRLTANRAVQM